MNTKSLHYFILIVGSLAVAFVLTWLIRKVLDKIIQTHSRKLNSSPTNISFLKNSAGFIVYLGAIFFIIDHIPYLKNMGTALFAGAGVLAVVVGFASQKAFANIITGIFILIFKPFKIDDIIEFKDGSVGVVEEITLRHTLIKNYENKRIIIPNSIISEETIINSNIQDEQIRKHVVFSISYDSDIDLARSIIQEEAEKHPLCIDHRSAEEKANKDPIVLVRVVELGDFSVDLKAYVWALGFEDAFSAKCDILESVKKRFDKVGIEIPFPYRTVVYKKDLEEKEAVQRESD